MRVLLICGVGASSGFLALNMRNEAAARGVRLDVVARGEAVVADYIDDADLLMVGPHMGHALPHLKTEADLRGIPMIVVPTEVYATLDGARAVELVLKALRHFRQDDGLACAQSHTGEQEEDLAMRELKVLLVCGSGASSGFMATNINKAAKKRGVPVSAKARSQSEVESYIDEIDCIMVGPHLKYLVADLEEKVAGRDVKVVLMKKKYYSMLDGEGALNHILSIYGETEG